MVYIWYISVICRCHTYGGNIRSKTCFGFFCTFFYNDIPLIFHEYSFDIQIMSMVYHYKKRYGTNPKKVLLRIYPSYVCHLHMTGIYHVYTMYVTSIYFYIQLITDIYLYIPFFSGFRGTYRPPEPPSGTTFQTYMMKLILIFPIHKQCWKDSCPKCPSWQTAASKDRNSPLFNVPPVVDPSNKTAEVLQVVEALARGMEYAEQGVERCC